MYNTEYPSVVYVKQNFLALRNRLIIHLPMSFLQDSKLQSLAYLRLKVAKSQNSVIFSYIW